VSTRRSRRLGRAVAALVVAGALLAAGATSVSAFTFAPCPGISGFSCTSLAVPLDHSGALEGTVSLHIARKQAGATQSAEAVVALAGGPGQPALPLASTFAQIIAPGLGGRDFVTFDQRGTGSSNPLHCNALDSEEIAEEALELESVDVLGLLVELCALQIGSARGVYTTAESVADLESVRQALGYEKLVLYATSYGTKVALQYAERFPERVESLVLDSVVPADGPEVFPLETTRAVAPALTELCAARACRRITRDPVRDLARLVARLRRHPMKGRVYDGSGRAHPSGLEADAVFALLSASDLNPALRALFPGAVRSALERDANPMLQLLDIAAGLVPTTPVPPKPPEEPVQSALFLDTRCEDTPFPWKRSSGAAQRRREALAALHAFPRFAFYPFDSSVAWDMSVIPTCLRWPALSAPQPPPRALPDVPALILSGTQDLRTPTAGARALAAKLPRSTLAVIPRAGHAVLASDLSGCAARALAEFFGGARVGACAPARNPLPPTPSAPDRFARVRAFPGVRGRAGRTLAAALDSLSEFDEELTAATLARGPLPVGTRFGGLHGGFEKAIAAGARFVRFSVIPGVTLSGVIRIRHGREVTSTLVVGGRAAAHGRLSINSRRVRGRLGRVSFDVARARAKLATAQGAPGEHGTWSAASLAARRRGARGRAGAASFDRPRRRL
jgi:pimeloyl-ACP methyl ester carboxylesterase